MLFSISTVHFLESNFSGGYFSRIYFILLLSCYFKILTNDYDKPKELFSQLGTVMSCKIYIIDFEWIYVRISVNWNNNIRRGMFTFFRFCFQVLLKPFCHHCAIINLNRGIQVNRRRIKGGKIIVIYLYTIYIWSNLYWFQFFYYRCCCC